MHKGNIRFLTLIGVAITFFLTGCGADIKAKYNRNASSDPATFAEQTIRYVNEERKLRGLNELTIAPKLMQASQFHTEYMAREDCYEHECPDGPTVAERYQKFDYRWFSLSENIAAGYTTPWEAFVGWMTSPGHRANILAPATKTVGAGYRYDRNDGGRVRWGHYWAMNFAVPLYAYKGTPDEAVEELFRLANELRVQNGLAPFNSPPQLSAVAREEARLQGKAGCDGCDPNKSYIRRLEDAGYENSFVIAYNFSGVPTPKSLAQLLGRVEADSKFLDPATRDIGIGYYFKDEEMSDDKYAHYWTILYGIYN